MKLVLFFSLDSPHLLPFQMSRRQGVLENRLRDDNAAIPAARI